MSASIQRVLVTGAAGFIGSHLTEACVAAGYEVRAFVRYNSRSSLGWLEESAIARKIEIIRGDIRDYEIVSRAVRGVDTVFHLAALIGIPYSYESPLAYVRTNVEGTTNVLMAARAKQVNNVILTSTSETYGSAQRAPIDESHPAVAQSPYAATKIAADQLGLSFHRSFGLGVKVIRPFNTYGPRQSLRAVIPATITQLLSGTQVKLGSLHPTRDLTYVADTVAGFLAVARSDATVGLAVNVGMNHEISIGDLVQLISRLMGVPVEIVESSDRVRPQASEVDRLVCDNRLLRSTTDWHAGHTLQTGLQETIEWFRRQGAVGRAAEYHV